MSPAVVWSVVGGFLFVISLILIVLSGKDSSYGCTFKYFFSCLAIHKSRWLSTRRILPMVGSNLPVTSQQCMLWHLNSDPACSDYMAASKLGC